MLPVTEKAFSQTVVAMAQALGWTVWRTWDSRHSPAGEPDLRMAHPVQKRQVWAELKTDKGKVTEPQQTALDVLRESGAEAYLWRPAMMDELRPLGMPSLDQADPPQAHENGVGPEADVPEPPNEDPGAATRSAVPKWLDAHKDEVLALVNQKGVTVAARQFGIKPGAIHDWRMRRGHPKFLKRSANSPGEPKAPKVPPPPGPGPERDINYWKGKYEGIVEGIKLTMGARSGASS